MDDKKIKNEQSEINELAKNYYFAVKNNDRSGKIKYWGMLYDKVTKKDNEIYKSLMKNAVRYKQSGFDIHDVVNDAVNDLIMKYDYDKNNNFCAYLLEMVGHKLKDNLKKQYYVRSKKDKDGNKEKEKGRRNVTKSDENGMPELDGFIDNTAAPDEQYEKKELAREVRNRIVSAQLKFWEHNKGRNANPVRYSYFRIFFTENLIYFVTDSKNTTGLNNAEVYDNTDKQLVEFVSFGKYDSIDDLLRIKFKKYSDVIENYSKADKEIFVPFENIIIQKYRVKNGFDKKEVSSSNVTQQRNVYKEYLAKFFPGHNR